MGKEEDYKNISEAAAKMSVKEPPSFWRQVAIAALIDAIPQIPKIVDTVCKLTVPDYAGSDIQQNLKFNMQLHGDYAKYDSIVTGIQRPSAISTLIKNNPDMVNGAINMGKEAVKTAFADPVGAAKVVASAVGNRVSHSMGASIATGAFNAGKAVVSGAVSGGYALSEVVQSIANNIISEGGEDLNAALKKPQGQIQQRKGGHKTHQTHKTRRSPLHGSKKGGAHRDK